MSEHIEITHQYPTMQALKNAFMPYVQDGGIFIPTEQVFHLGEFVKVSLTLPETDHTFSFSGEVIWVTPKTTQHNAGIGIQCGTAEGDAFQKEARELLSTFKENESDTNRSDTM